MTFTPTVPSENFPILRMVSESGRWEYGLVPVLFGVRVRAGIVGGCSVTLDYCAGDNPTFALELMATVIIILESLPESITPAELEKRMPTWERRPINHDPCWPKLLAMAEEIANPNMVAV